MPVAEDEPAADPEPAAPAEPAAEAAPDPVVDPGAAALALIAEIEFAGGTPQIGPPADINPWDIYVVGYPYWFWTDGPTTLTDSQESQGVEVSIDAVASSTTFTMGDGTTLTCDPSTAPKWSEAVDTRQQSSSCAHTWIERSATPESPQATHTVTATTTWTVDWAAGGESGTEVVERSQSTELVVGELQALVTG